MKSISDRDYDILRTKLPLVLKYCRIPANNLTALNAARLLQGSVRRMNNAARQNRQKQRPT